MEGAVLVDNRSGVTFDAELCIPWDAPRVVVDITSTEAFTPVPLPHRVVLLSRDEDVDDRRILPDRIVGWCDFGGRKCTAQTGNPAMSR